MANKKIRINNLVELAYNNSNYTLKQKENLVFHGINSKHIPKNRIIKPRSPDMKFYKHYLEYLNTPKIHLGDYRSAGISNTSYDTHFGFDIDKLKKACPEIRFMNPDVWFELAFYDTNRRKTKEKKLFLRNFKPGCEIIVDALNLNLADFIFYYEKKPAKTRFFKCKKYNAYPIRKKMNQIVYNLSE